jgi:hypothetical protein
MALFAIAEADFTSTPAPRVPTDHGIGHGIG